MIGHDRLQVLRDDCAGSLRLRQTESRPAHVLDDDGLALPEKNHLPEQRKNRQGKLAALHGASDGNGEQLRKPFMQRFGELFVEKRIDGGGNDQFPRHEVGNLVGVRPCRTEQEQDREHAVQHVERLVGREGFRQRLRHRCTEHFPHHRNHIFDAGDPEPRLASEMIGNTADIGGRVIGNLPCRHGVIAVIAEKFERSGYQGFARGSRAGNLSCHSCPVP